MNYKNALKWLNEIPISFNKDYKGYKLTLKKVYDLFNYLKNPEKKLKIIHIEGTNGKIIVDNPWMPGKDGGPYHSTIRIIKNNTEEIKNFKGPEHLFFFEAELSSQTILKEKQQVPYPGMTWEDTLGNLKVLDLWRQKINYQIKEDNL